MKNTELLAPVRDETSFTAALNAGADAVYLGLGQLNMRLNSPGIELQNLPRIVQLAHDRNVKVYVTLNTIIYDHELELLNDTLDQIKTAHADAVICWDLAVIQQAQKLDIPIHISTQASISNLPALKFYQGLGARRVVLARELTLEQIKHLRQNSDIEIEVFVHGAMCVSVSGRCFISQFLTGRSANRGDCIQPCRRSYHVIDTETDDELEVSNGYVLSPKDLCTLGIIDQLIAAGIDVFKIEGRSRAPEYIHTVTAAYRQAIDAVKDGTYSEQLIAELTEQVEKVYHREFSTGFLLGRPGPHDFSTAAGNAAPRQKEFVGTIINYYQKSKIIHANIHAAPLTLGDTIQIHGPTTGVIEMKITQLRDPNKQDVTQLEKTTATFPFTPAQNSTSDKPTVRRNDKIYRFTPRSETDLICPKKY